jgi:protein tyrosine phosphatase
MLKKENTLHFSDYDDVEKHSMSVPFQFFMDNIYVGNLLGSIDEENLRENKIVKVVRIMKDDNINFDNMDYLVIQIEDSSAESNMLAYCEEFYNVVTGEGNVFVHCQHGSSRTGAYMIYYIMKKYKMSFDSAYVLAKSIRQCIRPNEGFIAQLKRMEPFILE